MKCRRIIRDRHTYWNIKGWGDAARVSIGKFLFFRGKGCGGFCSKSGTNVPPQILPRFSTPRQSKGKEMYGKTKNSTQLRVSEKGSPRTTTGTGEGPGP